MILTLFLLQSVVQGMKWYKRAGAYNDAVSCFRVGELYDSVNQIRNVSRARCYMARAAALNSCEAMQWLGMHLNDAEMARYWTEQSAGYGKKSAGVKQTKPVNLDAVAAGMVAAIQRRFPAVKRG